jgi:hypothetical protein
MTMQAEITGVERVAYRYDGLIYVISGSRLFQVDHNHFFEFIPGNEFYRSRLRKLRKLSPLPHSELQTILSNLKRTIEEII